MYDWSDRDHILLNAVEPVVRALSFIPSEQIMLVGAQCRDLLHWRFGCGAPPSSTNDTDVALALPNWDQFIDLRARFNPIGDSGHRFLIAGIPTDIIPFGDIEAPQGISSYPRGQASMNVHGFRDTYQRAEELPISEGCSIRIPRPDGYAILKTHAWLDRSAAHNYKDGPDLALAVFWYSQDTDHVYAESNYWALEAQDFDLYRAAGALLGADMRHCLSTNEMDVMSTRILGADRDLLAQHFAAASLSWPPDDSGRRPIVNALLDQISR